MWLNRRCNATRVKKPHNHTSFVHSKQSHKNIIEFISTGVCHILIIKSIPVSQRGPFSDVLHHFPQTFKFTALQSV